MPGTSDAASSPYAYLDALTDAQLHAFKAQAAGIEVVPVVEGYAAAPAAIKPQLVAEGDSWFDYLPGTDLIDCLRNFHGYRIKNFAQAGDTLENMLYGTKYTSSYSPLPCQFSLVLEAIAAMKPKVFLFSGGGNDIAGDEFATYLNHMASGRPLPLREEIVSFMFSYFKDLLQRMITEVLTASPNTHIVMHGYASPLPTGKGVGFLGFNFAGPWLRPALASKNITDMEQGRQIVASLIDRYNALLDDLQKANPRFHHADVRDLVDPHTDWANELHLINSAYARVADRINAVIESIPG